MCDLNDSLEEGKNKKNVLKNLMRKYSKYCTTKVPEKMQLVIAISNLSEVRSEHRVCFEAFLRL